MEEKQLINLISKLKSVEPDANWVILNRSRLAFRLEMERKKDLLNRDYSVLRELFAFWGGEQPAFWKLAKGALAGLLIALGLGGATVWAAKQSLPGAPLYQVKIALEKARMSVSFSQEGKLELQAQMAENRLAELKEVMQISEPMSQKKEKVAQVMDNIKNQLNDVNDNLSKTQPAKAAEAIKATAKVEKTVSQVKDVLSGEVKRDLNKQLAELADTADKAGIQALEMILKSPDEAQAEKDDILAKVDEKILNAEAVIKEISQKADSTILSFTSDNSNVISDNSNVISDNSNVISDKTASELPMVRAVLIKDQSDKAEELLNQARSGLNGAKLKIAKNDMPGALNDLAGVLETINLAKTMIKSAQTIINSVEPDSGSSSEIKTLQTGDNASSSGPIK